MRRWFLAAVLLLFASTTVVGQLQQLTEDYEDDSLGYVVVGSNPSEDWYSIGHLGAALCLGGSSTTYSKIVSSTAQVDGSIEGKSLRYQSQSSNYCGGFLDMTPPVATEFLKFDVHLECGASTSTTLYFFRIRNADNQVILDSWFRSTGSTTCNFEWRLNPSGGPDVCPGTVQQPGGTNVPSTSSHTLTIRLDYSAQQYTASSELPGCTARTLSFNSVSTSIGRIDFQEASSTTGQRHLVIDNWGTDVPEPPAPPDPAEFEAGFKGTVVSLGFASVESQMLFTIILVGSAVVLGAFLTAIMGEGTGRNWIVYTTSVIAGVFCVYFLIMEFWIFTLALVLSTVIIRGGAGFTNSFKALVPDVASAFQRRPTPTTPERPPDEDRRIFEGVDRPGESPGAPEAEATPGGRASPREIREQADRESKEFITSRLPKSDGEQA